jgi:molybdate transport system substrate-binding protein
MRLTILSGGAAQALVRELASQFKLETGCDIEGTYGAVGAMREKLVAGAPTDLLILTAALIGELARAGHVRPGSIADIGVVRTAVAVRAGDALPPIADAAALRAALLAADAIYYPDPALATAGIHFAGVIETLGLAAALGPRLLAFPNGATAMRALAGSVAANPIGCTQTTEIVATPGVALVGPLPHELGLATVYTAGVCTRAALPEQAARLAAILTGPQARGVRLSCGFEPSTTAAT